MSRRKVDYVYVPKKKIKKVVIDAKKGRKSVEKTVNQRQILDGAYVRASAMKEFPNGKFANGGITKNSISVGDIVIDKNDNKYYIVYEVKNGAATKRFLLPREVAESIAFEQNPELIDWNRYTMYSDQLLPTYSVGDMVYVESARKSGVIFRISNQGEYAKDRKNENFYSVRFANDTIGNYFDEELELVSTYKRGGNIGSYNTGRSWTLDHNQHNKSENYEIPMDDRKFAKGGTIKNQYAGKSVEQVWNMWTPEQREHFLHDHFAADADNYDERAQRIYKDLNKYKNSSWRTIQDMSDLDYLIKYKLQEHINMGEYKRGGNIGSYNTGRSWTLDHNQHNKSESYEIPMNDRKYATGGEIPDLTNMNIDHLFANGGRTYPMTEEKIYS